MAETDAPSIARASAIVALGNIASRVLGLLRDIVLSNVFGASRALESFNNAVLVSRSIFDLLIAGHVSSAIVPVLSEVESTQGRDALWRVLAALAGAVIAILSVVVLVIIVSSGVIAGIIDDDWQTVELTGRLIQLTAPALLLMSLFALYSEDPSLRATSALLMAIFAYNAFLSLKQGCMWTIPAPWYWCVVIAKLSRYEQAVTLWQYQQAQEYELPPDDSRYPMAEGYGEDPAPAR